MHGIFKLQLVRLLFDKPLCWQTCFSLIHLNSDLVSIISNYTVCSSLPPLYKWIILQYKLQMRSVLFSRAVFTSGFNRRGHSYTAEENKRLSPGNYSLFVSAHGVAMYLERFVFVYHSANLILAQLLKRKFQKHSGWYMMCT